MWTPCDKSTGGPSSLQERGRDSCLQTVLCYKWLFTNACMGCKWFFLKERKSVMFLNKIDLPYCLVVFFVVCPRLRPFWSVFGELLKRYFGVPLLRERQGRTVISGVSVARGEWFRWKITPGLNSSGNSKQRCCSSMSIHSICNSSHRLFTSDAFIACSIGFRISN